MSSLTLGDARGPAGAVQSVADYVVDVEEAPVGGGCVHADVRYEMVGLLRADEIDESLRAWVVLNHSGGIGVEIPHDQVSSTVGSGFSVAQVNEDLLELLDPAGHVFVQEARCPMDVDQRQRPPANQVDNASANACAFGAAFDDEAGDAFQAEIFVATLETPESAVYRDAAIRSGRVAHDLPVSGEDQLNHCRLAGNPVFADESYLSFRRDVRAFPGPEDFLKGDHVGVDVLEELPGLFNERYPGQAVSVPFITVLRLLLVEAIVWFVVRWGQ